MVITRPPLRCKLANTTKHPLSTCKGVLVAKAIAVNASDKGRLRALVEPTAEANQEVPAGNFGGRGGTLGSGADESREEERSQNVDLKDANMGQLSETEKRRLLGMLGGFVKAGLFPVDSKKVPPCKDMKLRIPLTDEKCKPFAARQRRYSPEERAMMQAETAKLESRGVISPSFSEWAAQCVCVWKKDGT